MAESNNLIKVKYVLDTSEFDKLSKEEVRAKQELQKFNQELRNTAKEVKQSITSVGSEFDKLSKDEAKAKQELQKLNQELKNTSKEGKQATTSVKSGLDGINSSASSLKSTIGGLFAIGSIVAFGKELLSITANFEQMRKAIDFATGSNRKGGESMQFLIGIAKQYGLQLKSLVDGYRNFTASSNLAGTSLAEINRQYLAIAKASATLGLSSERTKLVLNGLAQIASKGVVSMEELRQQIGDSLPGALGIAAKSMNMTTQAFIKFVSDGKLLSAEFLPKFATELEKTFGSSAAQNVDTLTGRINNLSTSFDLLKTAIGAALFDNEGKFSNFGRGLQIVLDKFNELFATDKMKREAESFERITKVVEQYGKASEKVIQDEINERGVKIRQIEKEGYARKKQAEEALSFGKKMSIQELKDFEAKASQTQDEIRKNNDIRIGLMRILAERKKANDPAIIIKTAEQLKKEYDLLVKQLDLQKQIAAIKIQIANKPGFEREFKLLQNDLKFGEKRLALDKQYAAQKVEAAIDNAKLQVVVNEKLNVDLARLGKENTADALKEIQKMREANQKYEADKLSDQEKSLQKERELDAERVKDKQTLADKFKDIDDKSRAEKKKLEEDLKDITVQEAQITTELVSTIYNGFYNIRQQQLANELTLTQRKYAEEIRLAGDNAQRVTELQEQLREKEKEIRIKQFNAQKQASIVNAIFNATPKIVEYSINPATIPLAIAAGAILATQIAFIAAQPVPEFKEGTKGKKFKGKAIVGEAGVEKVVTESGKVYFTPPTATLADFKEPVQIIPNHSLNKNEIFWASQQTSAPKKEANPVIQKLDEINSTLNSLPIHQITLNKKGFETFVTTSKRTTKILNNQFPTRK